KEGQKQRQRANPKTKERPSTNPGPESRVSKQLQSQDRVLSVSRMKNVKNNRNGSDDKQSDCNPDWSAAKISHSGAGHQRGKANAGKNKSDVIKAADPLTCHIRDVERGEDHSQNCHRQVDPEDPPPRKISGDKSANWRSDNRPDQSCNR